MDKNIEGIESWDEAANWLARHGYGLEQIRMQKELWEEARKPAPAPTPVKSTAKTKKD